jgi:hypothetical protein
VYHLRQPYRGALDILKQAKAAIASHTALRNVSILVPIRLESESSFTVSRGIRLNVITITDYFYKPE